VENTPPRPLKIALYLRVSTSEQTHEPQRRELLEYAGRKGWGSLVEYSDQISGAKFSREGLDKLMRAVRKRQLDVVLCVKLDRLGRSLPHLAQMIEELDKHKVALICTSQSIDTSSDNPAGMLQMHVLMAVAQFERSLIRERTKAGLEAAKARGARIGRPRVDDSLVQQVAACMARDPKPTMRAIAAELKVSLGSVSALAKRAQALVCA
jgi:DNA invertase Pin-like site-specific DNA recombinase